MKKRLTHRLCIRGYANIVRGLAAEPATALELSARHDVTEAVMRRIVKRLHAQRVIRIAEWRQPGQGPAMRVFGFGGEPDAPRPLTLAGKPSRHIGVSAPPPHPTLEITSFGVLMRSLAEKRGIGELAEITGISRHTLSRNLKHMRSIGLVYIAGWERRHDATGGAPLPLYRIGIDKRDMPKPPRQTKQQSNARYNAARRAMRGQLRLSRAICSNSPVFTLAA